jgi:cytochrome c biogenesis protein CcmG, thiol:disulfide interchange protein DsbE
MRRFVLPALIVAAAVGLLSLLTFGVSHQTDTSSIDAQVARGRFPVAPSSNLALPLLGSAGTRSLASFRGKVVVLNVFASWCGPCASEAPLLAQEQRTLSRSGATLVGVTYLDNTSASEQFAHRYHITYPVLRDVSGNFVRSFGTTGVPETFVINRQGQVQALQRFPITHAWLSRTLPRILAERS